MKSTIMKQEFNGLLNDICEYFEREEDASYPRRYKRLDPRSLLGRAYTMLEQLEGKVHEAEEEQRSYPSCTCWRDMDADGVDNDDD